MSDPWRDPESGTPYSGPPRTVPPGYGSPGAYPGQPHPGQPYPGQPPYGYPYSGYGVPPYGYPGPWGPFPPAAPRRPGQVLGAVVLAFVQAGVAAIATAYVFLFVSFARVAVTEGVAPGPEVGGLASEGTTLGWLQLASVALLVAGGILVLVRRRRRPAWLVLVGGLTVQLVLALYWGVRLSSVGSGVEPDPAGVFAWFALFFAAMPAIALGLVSLGPGRAWFREEPPPAGP